jgi:hypothetical protein
MRIFPSLPASVFYLAALPYLGLMASEVVECATAPGYPWGCECAGPAYASVDVYRETVAIETLWICAALILFACRKLHTACAVGGVAAFFLGVVVVCTGSVGEVVAGGGVP